MSKTLILLPLLLVAGCASFNSASSSFDQAAKAYYAQERTFEPVSITGITTLNLAGENIAITTRAPLNQLSILPKDPSTSGKLIEAAESVARIGLGVWAADSIVDSLSGRPTIVEQPAPLVIEKPVSTGRYSPGANN